MKSLRILCVLTVMSVLTACQTTSEAIVSDSMPVLNDSAFPAYDLFEVESEEEIFALNDEAKRFAEKTVRLHHDPTKKIKALVSAIFDRSDFNLLYRNDANTTASDTFDNKAANCLSMSIMTYALAEHVGFRVSFQDIQIPEYWTRRDGASLLNGHVNVLVKPPEHSSVIRLLSADVVVDFDPQDRRKYFPVRELSKAATLAMFYNNKGADALLEDSYSKAYAYFRAAAKLEPNYDGTWVNLGILYRRAGFPELAKKSYEKAIEVDSNNLTAWENLAFLYTLKGETDTANEIIFRVERQRQDNPFYHFILGEESFDQGYLEEAVEHFTRAYRLDSDMHEVLFGLSKSYYELGDINRAEKYLNMAKRRAPSAQEEARYEGKLSKLRAF